MERNVEDAWKYSIVTWWKTWLDFLKLLILGVDKQKNVSYAGDYVTPKNYIFLSHLKKWNPTGIVFTQIFVK